MQQEKEQFNYKQYALQSRENMDFWEELQIVEYYFEINTLNTL